MSHFILWTRQSRLELFWAEATTPIAPVTTRILIPCLGGSSAILREDEVDYNDLITQLVKPLEEESQSRLRQDLKWEDGWKVVSIFHDDLEVTTLTTSMSWTFYSGQTLWHVIINFAISTHEAKHDLKCVYLLI